ncbi:hypothetical protein KHP60_04505 [Microvirga sp. 3-52]|uniref:hypothetical protein n=1 Tax=Microvirga sp. 3-52 TaxID=2792425 RepID=UPI001AC2CBC4|nr:hypothetical protein [Microvirga sp. 3-52]MBO1903994.1 hypothetical protein [Microvirga sp. 3-52]MBS7451607.1 hypothetical protein [Microvirga sp. 3-52]
MADQEEPGIPVSAQVVELTATHMAYVLASVISKVLAGIPNEHRQNVFYALSGAALQSANNVDRDLPDHLIREVQQVARIYVEGSLDSVASHLGLKAPENDRGGPTAH